MFRVLPVAVAIRLCRLGNTVSFFALFLGLFFGGIYNRTLRLASRREMIGVIESIVLSMVRKIHLLVGLSHQCLEACIPVLVLSFCMWDLHGWSYLLIAIAKKLQLEVVKNATLIRDSRPGRTYNPYRMGLVADSVLKHTCFAVLQSH